MSLVSQHMEARGDKVVKFTENMQFFIFRYKFQDVFQYKCISNKLNLSGLQHQTKV